MASPAECGYCGHFRHVHDIGKPAVCHRKDCDCIAFESATEGRKRLKIRMDSHDQTICVDPRCEHKAFQHNFEAVGEPCSIEGCLCDHFRAPLDGDNYPPQSKTATIDGAVGAPNPETTIYYLIKQLGLDPESEGLKDTPRRVAGYLREFTQPFDPEATLKEGFDNPAGATGAMVVQTNIPFRGCCEHHLLPFHGTACIGYIPKARIVGLSKLTRLVQGVGTRRPSTQEEISNTIVDSIDHILLPVGVIVLTEAVHTCMTVRGVNAPNVITKVSAIRGVYRDVPSARSEFFDLIRG